MDESRSGITEERSGVKDPTGVRDAGRMSYSLDEQGSWEQEKERADSPSRGQSLCQHWWHDIAPDSQALATAESTYGLAARTAE